MRRSPLHAPTEHTSRVRLRLLVVATVVAAATLLVAVPAVAAPTFDPLNVIPYETFRASSSMSAADIQAFLNTVTGPLGSLDTTDYVTPGGTGGCGVPWKKGEPKKTAAEIISEACTYWNINPKLMLATLQKEESLLTTSDSQNAARLKKAVGCGVYGVDPKTGATKNRYPGFGNQIWNAARVYSTYEIVYKWGPGMKVTVTLLSNGTTTTIKPKNASTFALYKYTPYYPQSLVWSVYVRYFGDPQTPPRLRPVYRFRAVRTGTYFYTASEATRYTLLRSSAFHFDGVAFTVDTSSTANTNPLYQLRNKKTGVYFYTPSGSVESAMVASKAWKSSGSVCRIAAKLPSGSSLPVYRLDSKATHATLYTSSAATKSSLTSGKKPAFRYVGIAFYVGRSVQTTTPIGPS